MKKYTIKKGSHYSGFRFAPHFGVTEMSRKVMFTESCLYPQENNDTKYDLNKLFGVSMGFHHKNSIRIGWRPELGTDKIEVWRYEYYKGERIIEPIGTVVINVPFDIKITLPKEHSKKWGYYLFPYMGGNEPAQQDTVIYMGK